MIDVEGLVLERLEPLKESTIRQLGGVLDLPAALGVEAPVAPALFVAPGRAESPGTNERMQGVLQQCTANTDILIIVHYSRSAGKYNRQLFDIREAARNSLHGWVPQNCTAMLLAGSAIYQARKQILVWRESFSTTYMESNHGNP